jgi:acetylornithine deacetylase/succinyl-diaminopimelate desuccinylase-like protein
MPRSSLIHPRSILADLVAIPSVSPEGDSRGTQPGEAALAAYTADFLGRLGADVRQVEVQPGRPNVVAVFEPVLPATATIALVPHLDTVGVAGMTVPPFKLTSRNGRLHGRGSCDTKGPFAALLAALVKWSRSSARNKSRIRWIVAATMGEETGGIGAQALVKSGFRADFAVALEPTALRVVHANKGVLRVWLDSAGRAAHGANPALGVNAIFPLLPLLAAIDTELRPQLARHVHPLLGPATVNLGVLKGGSELNIVPDQCRAGLDLRTHPACDNATVLRLIEQLRRRHAPGVTASVFRDGPSYVTPRTNPWARQLRQCGAGWAVASWFCDANRFAAAGIPAVAFGPGSIAQAHTRDEFITTRQLTAGAEAFGLEKT